MPSSMLFALNSEGRVFGLATNGTKWREFPYLSLDFKQISAVPHFLWALGGDRQIYLHVHGLDIPIKVKEESYENQRWYPLDGFSKRLLPTDRYQFSNLDGSVDRTLEKIRVPSMAWQWESEWHIETTLDGEPLDHDGWTYAVDFPATFYSTKQWSSCVRRRKWVRTRKYSALNSWCAIAPLHKDPTQEPFIYISVGGQSMSGGVQGTLQVWAVTAHGRVMWRKGVGMTCPEGTRWSCIPLPQGKEVKSLACGTTGLVWAILWSGSILVRAGISAGIPMGESWVDVSPPEGSKLMEVSIGTNSVWVLTTEKQAWFRKGIESSPSGTGWVGPIGSMLSLTVSSTDQVFGVGVDDRNIYFRVGVTMTEPTGKRWRWLNAAAQLSRGSSVSSLPSYARHRSTQSLTSMGSVEQCDLFNETSRSAPTSLRNQAPWQKPSSLPTSEGSIEKNSLPNSDITDEISDECNKKRTAWSPIRSVGSLLGLEANPDTDPHAEWDVTVWPERELPCAEADWCQASTLWSQVEAGAVGIPLNHLPNWFYGNNHPTGLEETPWRLKILESLKLVHQNSLKGFDNVELAIDMRSCVKTVECRCALIGSDNWEEVCIELEWVGAYNIDLATLTILSLEKNIVRWQTLLSEVTCIVCTSEPGSPRLSIHTLNSVAGSLSPLRIQFSGDLDLDDWLSHLTYVSCKVTHHEGTPSSNCIWAVTKLGDVYVFDQDPLKEQQQKGELFSKEIKCKGVIVPWKRVLENGFTAGDSITVEGIITETCGRFALNLECENEDNIALHINPRFDDGTTVVRNSMLNGVWGNEEREGCVTFERGTRISVTVSCQKDGFKISFNGMVFTYFEHRIEPERITHLRITGGLEPCRVNYGSKEIIVSLSEMVWRQMGGHLVAVETCAAGVTWGISADNTPWVYTGGWGGAFLGGLENSSVGINSMTDTCRCFVYENQRWNPLSGFTPRGLPTDRPMWSDSTGCHKRSKETTRLLSFHWSWTSDWYIDFLTPGGIDSDGWQYAVDFSTSFHPRKMMTDYVRRRRWARDCRLQTSGPWAEVGNTKVKSISLQVSTGLEWVCVWAVAVNGDTLFRKGVTVSNPMGDSWEHVPCEQPLNSISCGCGNQVWAVSATGSAYWRFGVTTSNPIGEVWELVEPPKGVCIKKVSVGRWAVWALDAEGKLFVRKEVTPVFPEGTHWQALIDPPIDKFLSVSASGDEVWAITSDGQVCKRLGVTCQNPVGLSWCLGLQANWSYVSSRSYTSKTQPSSRSIF
ncbi:tectonin beta-propeller repeat-containing protein [Halyomorpha halys]|uniref:tectonin beta-propeller repeat-containing protein n=1 Tax=Halyomorpha halys TaxID=286706 RepID=UPI0006D4FC7D|nr:tectonin beta-propeller repeat-containing protein [Halyomorpha halys]